MISTTGYYAPEAVASRLDRTKARAKKLEALASSIATQKIKVARAAEQRRRQRYEVVAGLRARGVTWREIGEKLGVTRQGAHFIFSARGKVTPIPKAKGAHGPSSATP